MLGIGSGFPDDSKYMCCTLIAVVWVYVVRLSVFVS